MTLPNFYQPVLASNTNEVQPAKPAMSDKPKRRWFQFSLKTLLVATVLIAGPAARIGYLRERALFHEREAAAALPPKWHLVASPGKYEEHYGSLVGSFLVRKEAEVRHQELAKQYRAAMFRPWRIVDESHEIEFRPQRYLHP